MAQQSHQSSEISSLPRLVRTTHSEDGTSIFASDERVTSFAPFPPKRSAFTVFDIRESVPVNNMDAIPSFANTLPRCSPQGAVFAISQIEGGDSSPMHRTHSIDYCHVLSGEIVLALDGGDEKTVKAGEFIVQQGVNHSWINRTELPCRLLFVMIGAEKVVLENGKVLEEDVFKKETSSKK
ncbi:hypothetical protein AK830_g3690 [Neonectria ditissima]|uniref:Cupin type-2 domain-containing protein n=1 Tax=Neonectria ditissima TaxID=78410 RepID=A0A0N8H7V7_9HYPO|nr:hypothetical protein AK830_g3690 [Neonectria ditissima]